MLEFVEKQRLYGWSVSWRRWFGSPDELYALAQKIDTELHRGYPVSNVTLILSWATRGDKQRATGSGLGFFADDLRASRREISAVTITGTVVDGIAMFPVDVETWPTKQFDWSSAPQSEVSNPPVWVRFSVDGDQGAKLTVLSASGMAGDRLFQDVEPYARIGAGKALPEALWRPPLLTLIPRFELTTSGRRWARLARHTATVVGFVGGIAGIVALIIA